MAPPARIFGTSLVTLNICIKLIHAIVREWLYELFKRMTSSRMMRVIHANLLCILLHCLGHVTDMPSHDIRSPRDVWSSLDGTSRDRWRTVATNLADELIELAETFGPKVNKNVARRRGVK